MHQCLGPCFQEIDLAENERYRKQIRKFLQGDAKEIIDKVKADMEKASLNLEFEKAQEYFEILQSIDHVMEKPDN